MVPCHCFHLTAVWLTIAADFSCLAAHPVPLAVLCCAVHIVQQVWMWPWNDPVDTVLLPAPAGWGLILWRDAHQHSREASAACLLSCTGV
jgi:hypothetical protein